MNEDLLRDSTFSKIFLKLSDDVISRKVQRQRPHGNPVAPPELARDAPVLDVAHPVVVNLRPSLWVKTHLVGARSSRSARSVRAELELCAPLLLDARPGLVHVRVFQKPLLAQARFDRHISSFTVADVVLIRLLLLERAEFLQFFRCDLARLKPVETDQVRAGQRVHGRVGVHDVDGRQVVAQADLEVGLVVSGRHLENAGAELEVHALITDDGNQLLVARPNPHLLFERGDDVGGGPLVKLSYVYWRLPKGRSLGDEEAVGGGHRRRLLNRVETG